MTFFRGKAPDAPESATARMKRKVDTQWKLYCLARNIEKLMNFGKIAGSQ